MTNIEIQTMEAVRQAARLYIGIDWEQRRYEIARTLMGQMLQRYQPYDGQLNPARQAAIDAVAVADELVIQLRKKGGWND